MFILCVLVEWFHINEKASHFYALDFGGYNVSVPYPGVCNV